MPEDIQATGYMGIAFETVAGTYVAPTKYFPSRSESLQYRQETHWRRPIRAVNDILGAVSGMAHVEGDVEMEVLEDIVPYWLYASRNTVVKTGAGPNYIYTTTPFHGALPTTGKTLSITVVRAGVTFGYTGCLVGSMTFGMDGQIHILTMSVHGRTEASQSLPTPTFTTTSPYGSGTYTVEIPTGTVVTDADTFELQIEDNASSEQRLQSIVGAAFVRFGERNLQLSVERDFVSRADYDAFKALTAQSITILASKGANNSIQYKLPVAIKDTYDMGGLQNQGDLVRAAIVYRGAYDPSTTKSYEIVVKTQENIT